MEERRKSKGMGIVRGRKSNRLKNRRLSFLRRIYLRWMCIRKQKLYSSLQKLCLKWKKNNIAAPNNIKNSQSSPNMSFNKSKTQTKNSNPKKQKQNLKPKSNPKQTSQSTYLMKTRSANQKKQNKFTKDFLAKRKKCLISNSIGNNQPDTIPQKRFADLGQGKRQPNTVEVRRRPLYSL